MRRALETGVLCVLCLCTSFLGQQDRLAQLYDEARQAEARGNPGAATRSYEEIVKLRPDMAEAHSNLGILYFHQNLPAKAKHAFRRALDLKPSLSAPHVFLGILAFGSRDYRVSLGHLKQAEARGETNTLVPLYLGYNLYALGDYAQANHHFEQVTLAEESNLDAGYHLSQSYGQLAKRYFAALQKDFPNSFYTNLARAHVYETERKWEDAKSAYEKALKEEPESEPLKRKLSWIQQNLQAHEASPQTSEPNDTIEGSTRYLYAPPEGRKIQEALVSRRNLLRKLRKNQAASSEQLYRLAEGYQILSYLTSLWVVQTDPNSYRAHQLKGQYYESIDKDDEAIQAYRAALRLKPDLQNVHFAIGNICWRRSRSEEALSELKKELELNPVHPQALYEIADTLISLSNPDEAEKYLERCLKSSPNMVEALLALERIYNGRGLAEESLRLLLKVTELAPKDPTAYYRMSAIYRKQGKLELAQASIERFEKLRAFKSQ